MAMGFGVFLVNARPEVVWKSAWRREFERRSAEEAAARAAARAEGVHAARSSAAAKGCAAAVEAKRIRRVATKGVREPRTRWAPVAGVNPPCSNGCGGLTRLAGGVCWQCARKARQATKRRFCARGCGTRLYRAADVCSGCSRLPAGLPAERRVCAGGCGRELRRDAQRTVCKPCWRGMQADDPRAHAVPCITGCGEATRNPDRVCWRCVKRPQRRMQNLARNSKVGEAMAA